MSVSIWISWLVRVLECRLLTALLLRSALGMPPKTTSLFEEEERRFAVCSPRAVANAAIRPTQVFDVVAPSLPLRVLRSGLSLAAVQAHVVTLSV